MKVITPDSQKKFEPLQLGDVVVSDSTAYIAMEVLTGKFVLKGMRGDGGLHGIHETLQALNDAFIRRGLDKTAQVFRKSEYDLVLVRREQ